MGKQRSIELLKKGETRDMDGFRISGGVPTIFENHYRFALKSMTPEHAAANAHDAVQRHLASVRDSKEGEAM